MNLKGAIWVRFFKNAQLNFYENLKAIYDPDIQIDVEEPATESGTEAI